MERLLARERIKQQHCIYVHRFYCHTFISSLLNSQNEIFESADSHFFESLVDTLKFNFILELCEEINPDLAFAQA